MCELPHTWLELLRWGVRSAQAKRGNETTRCPTDVLTSNVAALVLLALPRPLRSIGRPPTLTREECRAGGLRPEEG
jgi:hypothetical protein